MNQQFLIDSIVENSSDIPKLSGLFLAGSFGRDAADEYSDIDLVAIAEAGDHKDLAADWRKKLENIFEIVFWNQFGTTNILLNAITNEWQRIDLYIITKEDFITRAQDSLKVLIDP
ncbi:MAG: nucleotidyltransferase domain-containing protein [Rhizobiaceae bacterium]